MGILGLGSYVFLVVAGRSLSLAQFGRLSVLWSLLFGLVGGLAFPFEQETVRSIAASGRTRDVGRIAALAVGAVVVGEGAALWWGTARSGLSGDTSLLLATAVGIVGMPLAGLVRGMLVGAGRFLGAGAELATEGLFRGLVVLVLAGAGAGVGTYGLLLAGAPLLAALVVAPTALGSPHELGQPRPWQILIREVGTLLLGSGLALVVLNLGPLLATRSDGAEGAARLTAVFTLVRLPVFFSGPVAATLLPRFVTAVTEGDLLPVLAGLARRLGGLLLVGGFALGMIAPTAVRLLYGPKFVTSIALSLLLATSGLIHLVAMVLQAALVAGNARGAVVLGWAGGLVVLLVGTGLWVDASLLNVGWLYCLSSMATLMIMLTRVRSLKS